jgi:hypothetical protein
MKSVCTLTETSTKAWFLILFLPENSHGNQYYHLVLIQQGDRRYGITYIHNDLEIKDALSDPSNVSDRPASKLHQFSLPNLSVHSETRQCQERMRKPENKLCINLINY